MVDPSGHLVNIMNSLKIKISICTWRLWRWYCSAGLDQRRNCGFRLKPLKWSWTIASIRSNDTNKWRRCGRNLSCSWYTIQPVSKVIYPKYSKGQLISENNFGVLKSHKQWTKFLKDFCPSLYKGKIKKIKALYSLNIPN